MYNTTEDITPQIWYLQTFTSFLSPYHTYLGMCGSWPFPTSPSLVSCSLVWPVFLTISLTVGLSAISLPQWWPPPPPSQGLAKTLSLTKLESVFSKFSFWLGSGLRVSSWPGYFSFSKNPAESVYWKPPSLVPYHLWSLIKFLHLHPWHLSYPGLPLARILLSWSSKNPASLLVIFHPLSHPAPWL